MIKIKYGDLLNATEDLICHQCNVEGVFGGGVAYQIGQKWPECEVFTQEFARIFGPEEVLGKVHYWSTVGKTVCNCFSQNADYTTNYEMLDKILCEILTICKEKDLTVAMPYMYGCGIAKGDWSKVLDLLISISAAIDVDITLYYLGEGAKNAINCEE